MNIINLFGNFLSSNSVSSCLRFSDCDEEELDEADDEREILFSLFKLEVEGWDEDGLHCMSVSIDDSNNEKLNN